MRFTLSTLVLGLVATATAADRKINRRPDSEWDHIVRGSDLLKTKAGKAFAGAEGNGKPSYLANYQMRARITDPSELGVDTVKQLSGYLDDNENDKHLFFWFFESRNDPTNDPVVLWLNGGPGCSSMAGLFEELGPASIPNRDLKPVRNPYSWNNNASVIFLDQPVDTGFSYTNSSGSGVGTSVAAAKDINALLSLFFSQYTEYAEQPFHISGESYAGHYIPAAASEILSHSNSNINLKSILIGNGLTDPYTQYAYYQPMGCGQGGYPAVMDSSTCQTMKNAIPGCQKSIKACYDGGSASTCQRATNQCGSAMLSPYQRTGRSVYDVRANPPTGSSYAEQFLNQDKVQNAIGAEATRFSECNYDVYGRFSDTGDWMLPIHKKIPGILQKIPVLIYAGDADYICNWLGNQAWTNALDWPGKAAFNQATMKGLKGSNGKEYGQVKNANGFAFMRIYQAGHMVPADQPAPSLNFFNRWLGGEFQK
ncbi:hypothetical protein Golomagni_06140 [Golovinomyces magnicellulatus]|nr:hypothetical protein Golomagni_06140 [Golovinomyces magnicellulatus]